MGSPLHVIRVGNGPTVLLIHGSAGDHTTWSIQLASTLRQRFTLVAYDRAPHATVEDFAADAAGLLDARTLVVGSSFGAVIALEVARTHPDRVAGAVLIEPPMAASDQVKAAPPGFLDQLDRRAAEQGGPAAAELFLRSVLGDTAFERMPRAMQDRSKAKFPEIRADSAALLAYAPRYHELDRVTAPVLLLGGDRSAPYFAATLDALERSLPEARRVTVTGGHMLHAEAPRRFNELVATFAAEIGFV